MRRTLASILVVVGLLGSSLTPAHAIFGLSKCEKVKKEMLALEKQILDVHAKGLGNLYKQVVFRMPSDIWEPDAKTVKMFKRVVNNDPIPKIWKLATNNPKCFTNTQNMQIEKMKNSTYGDYFNYPVSVDKYKNTSECINLMENSNNLDYPWYSKADIKKTRNIISRCFIKIVYTYTHVKLYASIYSQ